MNPGIALVLSLIVVSCSWSFLHAATLSNPEPTHTANAALFDMHLVAIAWMYVVVMMAVAEAMSSQGTVFGAFITLVFYGILPLGLVLYIMATPGRKRARKAAEAAEAAQAAPASEPTPPQISIPDGPSPDR